MCRRLHPAMYLLALAYKTLDIEHSRRNKLRIKDLMESNVSRILSWCKRLVRWKPSDIQLYHHILVQPQKLSGNSIFLLWVTNLCSISTKAVLKVIFAILKKSRWNRWIALVKESSYKLGRWFGWLVDWWVEHHKPWTHQIFLYAAI